MFPWGFSRRDSKTKVEEDREKQLSNLKSAFPSIRRPLNDDSQYEMKIVVDGIYSVLRIYIPADFPLMRPVLQVEGPLTHPWLDQFKQVSRCENLLNWSKNSSLVAIVEETLSTLVKGSNLTTSPALPKPSSLDNMSTNASNNALMQSQPQIYGNPSNNNNLYSSHSTSEGNDGSNYGVGMYPAVPNVYPIHTSYPIQQPNGQYPGVAFQQPNSSPVGYPVYQQNTNPPPYLATNSIKAVLSNGSTETSIKKQSISLQLPAKESNDIYKVAGRMTPKTPITIPEPPKSFPELEKLTTTQLERLNSDTAALEAHVQAVESVKSMTSLRDQMRKNNFNNTSKNLALDVELNQKYRQVLELQSQLQLLSTSYKKKLQAAAEGHEMKEDIILKEMDKKKLLLDEKSEEIAIKFVDGEMDLNNFKQEYLETRTKYHIVCGKCAAVGHT